MDYWVIKCEHFALSLLPGVEEERERERGREEHPANPATRKWMAPQADIIQGICHQHKSKCN